MNIQKFNIDGLVLLESKVFEDSRGHFFESYNKRLFASCGIHCEFVQDNQSFSKHGTLRGIHLQTGDSAQAKLVRVTQGLVLDVAVDLRAGSSTFGQHVGVELSAENRRQLFIPKGFGHGFVVLSDEAIFQYKCDHFYDVSAERGILYNDSDLGIDWKLPESKIYLSEKDKCLPKLAEFKDS